MGGADEELESLLARYASLRPMSRVLHQGFELLRQSVESGGKILVCGNGGSASDSEHIVGELMKSFAYRRPIPPAHKQALIDSSPDNAGLATALEGAIPAVSLVGQIGLITAFGNDVDYVYAFAQQVYGLGRSGDALIAISTSGNSKNVLHACHVARLRGMRVLGLTGDPGGKLAKLCDVAICVPASQTHLVQELHLPVYHYLCLALERHFFGEHGRKS